jgi:hypothetical protein
LKLKIKENDYALQDKTSHYSLKITPSFSLALTVKAGGVIIKKDIPTEVFKKSANQDVVLSRVTRNEIYNLPL